MYKVTVTCTTQQAIDDARAAISWSVLPGWGEADRQYAVSARVRWTGVGLSLSHASIKVLFSHHSRTRKKQSNVYQHVDGADCLDVNRQLSTMNRRIEVLGLSAGRDLGGEDILKKVRSRLISFSPCTLRAVKTVGDDCAYIIYFSHRPKLTRYDYDFEEEIGMRRIKLVG